MYKDRKLLRLLAGLDEDITVCDVIEVRQKNGSTRIDIPITHISPQFREDPSVYKNLRNISCFDTRF